MALGNGNVQTDKHFVIFSILIYVKHQSPFLYKAREKERQANTSNILQGIETITIF